MSRRDPIDSLMDRFEAMVREHGVGAGMAVVGMMKRHLASRESAVPTPAPIRGRGRPKGVKNKSKAKPVESEVMHPVAGD